MYLKSEAICIYSPPDSGTMDSDFQPFIGDSGPVLSPEQLLIKSQSSLMMDTVFKQ